MIVLNGATKVSARSEKAADFPGISAPFSAPDAERGFLFYELQIQARRGHVAGEKLVLSAMFLALSLALPLLTGQIPEVGSMLLPMHIPVLLCGMIVGGPWGAAVGFVAPLRARSCSACRRFTL